jgi:NTE family protein
MDRRFFHGRTLASLDSGCRFVINAANIVTGVRFAFERDVVGDYVTGLAPTPPGLRVSFAAAASAAVPGAFAPLPSSAT